MAAAGGWTDCWRSPRRPDPPHRRPVFPRCCCPSAAAADPAGCGRLSTARTLVRGAQPHVPRSRAVRACSRLKDRGLGSSSGTLLDQTPSKALPAANQPAAASSTPRAQRQPPPGAAEAGCRAKLLHPGPVGARHRLRVRKGRWRGLHPRHAELVGRLPGGDHQLRELPAPGLASVRRERRESIALTPIPATAGHGRGQPGRVS